MDTDFYAAQNDELKRQLEQLNAKLAYQEQTLQLLHKKTPFYTFEYYSANESFVFSAEACRRFEFPASYPAPAFIAQQVVSDDRQKVHHFLQALTAYSAEACFQTDFLIQGGMTHIYCRCQPDASYTGEGVKVFGIFTEQDDAGASMPSLTAVPCNYCDMLLHSQLIGMYEFSHTASHVFAIKSSVFTERIIARDEFRERLSQNYHPDDLPVVHEVLDSANTVRWQDTEPIEIRREVRRKTNGMYRWARFEFYMNQPGIPRRFAFLFIRDVHDIHLKNQIFSSLGSNYLSIFYINCSTGVYTKLEPPFASLFTEQKSETGSIDALVLHTVLPDVHADDAELVKVFFSLEHIRQMVKKQTGSPSVIYRKQLGKGYIWIESTYYHIPGDLEHIIIGNSDVTAVMEHDKKMRENLSVALKNAKSANEAKSNFLSCMSHDIRTPLNAILGMGTIAERHITDVKTVSDCIQKIQSAGQHLLSLINDILDISKIEKNKVLLTHDDVSLSSILTDILLILNSLITEKHHIFLIFTSNLVHEQIIADSMRIKQILINLLSNAIKYTPVGGLIQFTIAEEPLAGNDSFARYVFIVSDNGIGMSEETLGSIFDAFVRANDRRINNLQGTGLGMAITKNLVELMHGTITVESALNKGSTFTVSIPFEKGKSVTVSPDIRAKRLLFISNDAIECKEVADVFQTLSVPIEVLRVYGDTIGMISSLQEVDYYAVILSKTTFDGNDGLLRAVRSAFSPDVYFIWFAPVVDPNSDFLESWMYGVLHTPLFKTEVCGLLNRLLQNEAADMQRHMPEQKILKGRNVLVVDDNEINVEITHEFISSFGAHISIATNGREAVNNVMEKPRGFYTMIFMDVQMPVMDGYEACRAIRKYEEDSGIYTPIVAMTADVFQEDIDRIKASGMDAHVAKPLDIKQLQKIVFEILRQQAKNMRNC